MRAAILLSMLFLPAALGFPVPKDAATPKVVGTKWNVTATWNSGSSQNYTLEFLEGGKLIYNNQQNLPCTWEIRDGKVTWEINHNASTWEASLGDGDCDGKGQNRSGQTATLRLTMAQK
jgi:hypothetical protein